MLYNKSDHIYYKEDFRKAIEETIDSFSNRIAFSYLKDDGSLHKWSYKDTLEEIKKIEAFYKQMEFKEHDRVAVIMPTDLYSAFVVLGLAYAGAIIVPVDISLPMFEIERLLIATDVAGIVLTETVFKNLSSDMKEKYPFLVLDKNNTLSVAKTKKRTARECDIYDNAPENIAIIYSSGTTAKMKGVCISYRSVIESSKMYEDLMRHVKFGNEINCFMVFPINHISGFGFLMTSFLYGTNIGVIETMNPSNLLKAMQIFLPYHFGFIPKFYDMLCTQIEERVQQAGKLQAALFHGMMNLNGFLRKYFCINIGMIVFKKINYATFGKNMTTICAGGAKSKRETEDFFWKLGYTWGNYYSSTETGSPCIAGGYLDKYPIGTVGKVDRFKTVSVKVVSKDINGIGEICIKSDYAMMCYFREPELTKKAFDEEGYFLSGDLGYIDENNYLHITGRKKEVILMRNGKKASPEDLEDIYGEKLDDLPIAVCGIPGRDGYDEIHLFVESNNQDIKTLVLDKLSDIKGIYQISKIHVLKNLPRTKLGKAKRTELVQLLMEEGTNGLDAENMNNNDYSAIEDILVSITGKSEIEFNDDLLLTDIGVDSIILLELVTRVEQKYNVNISNQLLKIQTIGDLKHTIILSSNSKKTQSTDQIATRQHYPTQRSEEQIRELKRKLNRLPKTFNISILHAERIIPDKQCIICINHQSLFDGMPVLHLFDTKGADISKIAYVAAHNLLSDKNFGSMFQSIGAIPIDRFVNATPAYEDMSIWLEKGGTIMVHPEGYLSEDCSLLPFKEGAAKLAIEHGVPILPIRIDGTHDILPKGATKLKLKENGKKIKISIAVGEYIEPSGYDMTALTQTVRNQILELG